MTPTGPQSQPQPADQSPNQALAARNGNSADGNANNGSASLADPQVRALMEQLLATLGQETAPVEERAPSSGFNAGKYRGVLRRRWKPMLAVFLLTLAAVAWRLRPTETIYMATATMLPPKSTAPTTTTDPLSILLKSATTNATMGTQVAILTSPPLIERALKTLPASLRRAGWGNRVPGKNDVQATAPSTSETIDIMVSAADPRAAIALANALVNVYGAHTQELADQSNRSNLLLMKQQVEDAKRLMLKAKQDLRDYKEHHHILDLPSYVTGISGRIQQLEQQAQAAQLEVAAGRASQSVQSDAIVMNLQQKASEARANYETVLRDFFPNSPEARQAEQNWHEAQGLVEKRINALLGMAQVRASKTQGALGSARGATKNLPQTEYQLTQLMDRVAVLEETHRAAQNRYTQVYLSRKADIDTPTFLSRATQAVPAGGTWTRALIMGIACALALALLVAALVEALDPSIHSVEDLEPLLRSPALGTMPFLKSGSEQRLAYVTNAQPAAVALLESARIVRSNLMLAAAEAPLRSVLITSADPAEGKSLCAFNIATVMAFDGKRVILIDCDLRRPTQHRLANVPLEPGFSNVLSGEATLEEALIPTSVANLTLLPGGTLPTNPPELLGSPAGRSLIEGLKDRCDIVVIDSPPVLSLTDAQVLSSLADGVVLVVAADSTPKPHVQRAQAMLRHIGGRLLGVILNKVQPHQNGHDQDVYNQYYSYDNLSGDVFGGEDKQLANGSR
jgi:capsular exopolysaccharide synthesis family protein